MSNLSTHHQSSMEEGNTSFHHQKTSKNTSTYDHIPSILSTHIFSPILPTDLSVEILLHLPIKSLLKFTSISKSWLSLIKSSYFIKSHLSYSLSTSNNYHLIYSPSFLPYTLYHIPLISNILRSSIIPDKVAYPMKPCMSSFSLLIGSIHGLVCLKNDKNKLIVWNPCTGIFRELPDCEMVGFCVYGFGYDEHEDDYKVVAISSSKVVECNNNAFDYVLYEYDVSIFSRNKGYWKGIGGFKGRDALLDRGIFPNGKVHWVNKCLEMKNGKSKGSIVAIDLGNASIHEVDQPYFGDDEYLLKLGMWEERLCVICHHFRNRVDLWAMREHGVSESWTLFASIAYDSSEIYVLASPWCWYDKDEILMMWGSPFNLAEYNYYTPKLFNHHHFQTIG